MKKELNDLKLEVEKEKRRAYLEKFGQLKQEKEKNKLLKDFN